MNKRFTSLMTTLILSVIFAISASAYDVEVDGIYYNLNKTEQTAEVANGVNQYKGNVTIPETIAFENVVYSVTSIGQMAFQYCYGLTSITIPNSVTNIGYIAFTDCIGLTSITIPNSVKSIEQWAFRGCSSLSTITIGNSVNSIGYGAFVDCTGLTSIKIPNSVTSIGKGAFSGCTGLTSITIPNSVTSTGEYAFSFCYNLTSVTIPNSVTSIGEGAFSCCHDLTSIKIPNSVISIGNYAFADCSNLSSIIIPNSVMSIGEGAFLSCDHLTSITIPNSVTTIGNWAFKECIELEAVYCYKKIALSTHPTVFKDSYIEKSTLYVPSSAIDAYKTTEPWSLFGTIKAIEETEDIKSVKARGIAIQSAGGFINISGLDNNEKVDFYAVDGKALGSVKSIDGSVSFSAKQGTVVVAKIGKESVKIAVE